MSKDSGKATTAARLQQIMRERNLRQVDILNAAKPFCEQYGVKLTKSALSQFISGRNEPKQSKLFILSLALDVDPVWLMGMDVPMRVDDEETTRRHQLLNSVNDILNGMTSDQLDVFLSFLKQFQVKKE